MVDGTWRMVNGTWRMEYEERFIKMMVERIATAKEPKPILDAAFQKETFSCGVGFTTLRSAGVKRHHASA